MASILKHLQGIQKLIVSLLYGAGLRLTECLLLRVKDIDFQRGQIAIWDSKSNTDRLVMLPQPLIPALHTHIEKVRNLYERDRRASLPGVELPEALNKKYPAAGTSWKWFWLFPSAKLSADSRSGIVRRHHLHDSIMQGALAAALRSTKIKKQASCHTFRHYAELGITVIPSRLTFLKTEVTSAQSKLSWDIRMSIQQ